jgi:O-antigen/teichoic acid export membrane protein
MGVIISYIDIFIHIGVMLVYTPLVLRILGQNEYGIYSLSVSVMSYLNLFSFGFSITYIRYYIKYKTEGQHEKVRQLNGMFICIFLAISIIVFVAGFIIIKYSKFIFGDRVTSLEYKTLNPLLSLMIFNLVIVLMGSVFNSLIGANEKFVFQKIPVFLSRILNPVVTVPLLFMGFGSIVIVIVQSVFNCIIFVINIVFCLKKLHIQFSFRHFDFSLLKELSGFSFFIFLQQIVDICNWQVDKYLITRFWGSAAVAIYSVGAQFQSVILGLSSTISAVFIPQVNKLVVEKRSKDEISDLLIKTGRIQFIVISFIVLAFAFLGKPVVYFWAGDGYGNAYYVALLLMFPLIIPLSQNLGMTIMRAKALHKMQMVINAVVALLNFLISIPLCKAFGEVGAALGTLISILIALNFLQSIYYDKVGGLDILRWFRQIIRITPAFIIPVFVGIFIMIFVNISNIAVFIVYAVAFTGIYFASVWFIGMNSYEKRMIGDPIRRVAAKIKRGHF